MPLLGKFIVAAKTIIVNLAILYFENYFFLHVWVFCCMYICVPSECSVHGGHNKVLDPLGTGVNRISCNLQCGFWESNLAPLGD